MHQRETLYNKLIPFTKVEKREQNLTENVYYLSIYTNSKFKVTNTNTDFDCWYIGTHTKEIPSKISNMEVAILLFYQNTLTKLPSWVLWSLLFFFCDKTIRSTTKWFILAQIRQKLEFVSLKYVTYTQPIWVALSSMWSTKNKKKASNTTLTSKFDT